MSEDFAPRLYLITPPSLPDLAAFSDDLARALDAGDVGSVQLRLKDCDDDMIRRAIETLMPVVHARDIAFILNDRPDLAIENSCDGVHIGRDDSSYEEARRIVGGDQIVGVTCHYSRHLALEDAEAGADYVAFGAFFPTSTKDAKHKAEVETLAWWTEMMEVPCVAIGGITAENCAPLVQAGADFLAVVSAVWDHPLGPDGGVRALNQAIAEALS